MTTLSAQERRALRAKAHHLDPVVLVGQHGLTPAVMHEIDVALRAHELIKIRVFNDDRGGREKMLAQICDELDAAPVQHLGKLLVVWRPAPAAAAAAAGDVKNKPSTTKRPAPRRPGAAAAKRGRTGKPVATPRSRARTSAAGSKPAAGRVPHSGPKSTPAAIPRRRRRTSA